MEINQIAVIGAGQMGTGIAQSVASAGVKVLIWDLNSDLVKASIDSIKNRLASSLSKAKITETEYQAILKNILACSSLEEVKTANLVIEAIVENTSIKQELFNKIEQVVSESSIIASNTSSISISKLGSCLKFPNRFIGIHFMNPVPVMQLVEIIPGLQTSDQTLKIAENFVKKINKVSVKGIDSPGFIVNRILCPMINEAIFLLEQGVKAEDIDQAMKLGTNQPMGPLELADFVGLDTLLYILKLMHSELGEDKYRPSNLLIRYVDAGWHGKKTKKGFYNY